MQRWLDILARAEPGAPVPALVHPEVPVPDPGMPDASAIDEKVVQRPSVRKRVRAAPRHSLPMAPGAASEEKAARRPSARRRMRAPEKHRAPAPSPPSSSDQPISAAGDEHAAQQSSTHRRVRAAPRHLLPEAPGAARDEKAAHRPSAQKRTRAREERGAPAPSSADQSVGAAGDEKAARQSTVTRRRVRAAPVHSLPVAPGEPVPSAQSGPIGDDTNAELIVPDIGSFVICKCEFSDGAIGIELGRVVAHLDDSMITLKVPRSAHLATTQRYATGSFRWAGSYQTDVYIHTILVNFEDLVGTTAAKKIPARSLILLRETEVWSMLQS